MNGLFKKLLKPLKVTSPIAKDASQNTTSAVDTARPAPVIRWKIDNTDVIWGLYTVKWGDRGLLSIFFNPYCQLTSIYI